MSTLRHPGSADAKWTPPHAADLPARPPSRPPVVPLARLRRLGRPSGRTAAVGLAGLIVAWAVAALLFEGARLQVSTPRAQLGVEVGLAAIRLFCAVVLVLIVAEGTGRQRLRWVAGGFVVLGLGSAVFGYLLPLARGQLAIDASLYTSLVVLTAADVFFVLGLLPKAPPRFTLRSFVAGIVAVGLLGVIAITAAPSLPRLVHLEASTIHRVNDLAWRDLTAWHWSLFAVPFVLATAAAATATVRPARCGGVGAWLAVAMIIFAGAHLHHFLWPTTYRPVLTSTNVLRVLSAGVVAVGVVIELRRAAKERTALLAEQREYARRLAELAVLRSDFTAMVGHELVAPVAAIRHLTDMLATGESSPAERDYAFGAIRAETDALKTLVADVRTAAAAERDDFAVRLRPVPIVDLLAEAAASNRVLPGNHPLVTLVTAHGQVLADPERIAQVLRNLIGNAAKYTPPGTPIELRAVPSGGDRIRIEVADQGPGLDPADRRRVFEKFGRGRDALGGRVPGVGLGLYLSRRIVRMHGSELTAISPPGSGATFGFELEVVA